MTSPETSRGYFAIGAERMSKSLNLGNLMRSAHAFGAAFTFTIGASYSALEAIADTSRGSQHLPHYDWKSVDQLVLPRGCKLVGIELLDDAIELRAFCTRSRPRTYWGPRRARCRRSFSGAAT